MKQYIASTVAVTGLIIFIFAMNTNAQSTNRVVANIPFDFYVGKELLPSGKYEFESANRNAFPSGVIVRSVAKSERTSMIVPTIANKTVEPEEARLIRFNRYGSVHYLTGIYSEPGSVALKVRKSSVEESIASRVGDPKPVSIRLTNATVR